MLTFKVKEAHEKYPFLNNENCIVLNFISLDAVEDIYLNEALNSCYPNLKNKLYDFIFKNKITKNNIFPFTNTKNNLIILNIPFKNNYDENIDEEMIKNLSEKINNYLANYDGNIYYCTKQISKEIIEKFINKKTEGV